MYGPGLTAVWTQDKGVEASLPATWGSPSASDPPPNIPGQAELPETPRCPYRRRWLSTVMLAYM